MTVITIITKAKCKHCIFCKKYSLKKKDGTLSKKRGTKCTNTESYRGNTDISDNDLICDKWAIS